MSTTPVKVNLVVDRASGRRYLATAGRKWIPEASQTLTAASPLQANPIVALAVIDRLSGRITGGIWNRYI